MHKLVTFGKSIKLILSRLVRDKNQGEISEHRNVHHIAIILLRASPLFQVNIVASSSFKTYTFE